MPTKKQPQLKCELCRQPVKILGFEMQTTQGKTYFCCQGCLSVYQLLNPDKTISKP